MKFILFAAVLAAGTLCAPTANAIRSMAPECDSGPVVNGNCTFADPVQENPPVDQEWSNPPFYDGGASKDGTCSMLSYHCVPPCHQVSNNGEPERLNPAVKPLQPGDDYSKPNCQDR
jgi:hypothetical protein